MSMPLQKWVLASRNPGKIREFQAWSTRLGIELVSAQDLAVPDIDEPYTTFIENALHKARFCSKYTGLPALADDSGLCVPAIQGRPGVYSARFAGTPSNDLKNNQRLLEALKGHANRGAYYYAILVLCEHGEDPQPCIAQGQWWGTITEEPKGEQGFGYDPLFWDPSAQKTAALLSPEEKQQRSHRGKALRQLEQQLIERYGLTLN
jgi:XTP/dITP diphosphohydrolase